MAQRPFGWQQPKPERIAGAQLGKAVKIGIQDGSEFRIPPRGLMIGQKHRRHPIARHLHGPPRH
eukprot:gene16640-20341_t